MKHISRYSPTKARKYLLPEIATEITFHPHQHSLPRHISRVETKSHRGASCQSINYVPKVCHVPLSQEQHSSQAFDILKYQLRDRSIQEKHLENVRCDLQRRLQKAIDRGNTQLIDILQDEYKQLETSI